MTEHWRPIPGFPNYSASDQGRVRRDRGYGCLSDRVLSRERQRRKGYVYVRVCVSGRATHQRVHRLVALAWLGPLPAGYTTDHINGDKEDNRLCNLRYVTARENTRSAMRLGLYDKAHRRRRTLCDDDARIAYWRVRGGERAKDVAADVGISPCALGHIMVGRTYRHLKLKPWKRRAFPDSISARRVLDDRTARSIKREWDSGVTSGALAIRHGVSVSVVQGLVLGRNYREISA